MAAFRTPWLFEASIVTRIQHCRRTCCRPTHSDIIARGPQEQHSTPLASVPTASGFVAPVSTGCQPAPVRNAGGLNSALSIHQS